MQNTISPKAEDNISSQQQSPGFLGRAVSLLLLIPLLAASLGLRKSMPPANLRAEFYSRKPMVLWSAIPEGEIRYSGKPFEGTQLPIMLMNVDTGTITASTRANLIEPDSDNSRGELVDFTLPRPNSQSFVNSSQDPPTQPLSQACAYFWNRETGVTRQIEYSWPHKQMSIVKRRFVVGRDLDKIYAIDLEDPQLREFSINSPFAGKKPLVMSIDGTDFLYQIHPPTSPTSTRHKLELFKLSDQKIQLVETVEMGCGGITRLNEQLLTLTADGKRADLRSLGNLELLHSFDISEQFLATHQVVDLWSNVLIAENKQTFQHDYYDIFSKDQLNLPFSGMRIRSYSNDNRYWCFRGDVGSRAEYAYVYDLQKRQICLSIQSNCSDVRFLEDGRFAVVHPAYGVCTVVYDLQTGKSIRHAPYQWYAVALAVVMMGWFGWCVKWLFVSAREGSWLWVDLALIFGIIPGILVHFGAGDLFLQVRQFSGFRFEGYSTDFASLLGAFIGLLCASALLVAPVYSLRSSPCVPLALLFAALCGWLGTLASRPHSNFGPECLRISLITASSVALVSAAGVLMRRMGSRLKKLNDVESTSRGKSPPLSLLDLFIFMACAALVMASAKPLVVPWPKISLPFLFGPYWLLTLLVASVISVSVMLLVLQQRIWMVYTGCFFASAVWCVLVFQQVLSFAGLPPRLFPIVPNAMQTIALAVTCSFICALALRLRSYRLVIPPAQNVG